MKSSNKLISNIYSSDRISFYILFLLTIIIVYFLPPFFKQIYFFSILSIFWKSKKNYFWFAFVLLIADAPGKLFTPNNEIHNLQFIDLFGFRELYFTEVFFIIAFIKSFKTRTKLNLFFKNNLYIFGFYTLFLFLISFTYFTDMITVLKTIRMLLPYTLIYSMPILMSKIDDYHNFFKLILPLAFIILIFQLAEITLFKNSINIILGGSAYDYLRASRVHLFYSTWLHLIIFCGSIFYATYKKNIFNQTMLSIIPMLVILSYLITGTRGYFIAFTLMLILYSIFIKKGVSKYTFVFVLFSILLYLFLSINPIISDVFDSSTQRILTMKDLYEGDVTAGGSLSRISDRSPRVMKKFVESPIFGFGFSQDYYEYSDVHVGNQTLLLQGGIIGYLLFLLFWFNFSIKLILLNYRIAFKNPYHNTPLIFVITLLGLLIIHSSSGYIFNYQIIYLNSMPISIIMIFIFASKVYKEISSSRLRPC